MTTTTSSAIVDMGGEELSATTVIMTQNIGTLEATGSTVSEEIKMMTDRWILGVSTFIEGTQSASNNNNNNSKNKEGKGKGNPNPPVDIFVLHMQEVGGKKWNDAFNDYICQNISKCWPGAGWCSGLLMHRQEDQDTFTAMGTAVFVSKRLVPITSFLSVRQRVYVALEDKPEEQPRDHLFHGSKFSNAEKSRKGYLLTSLRVGPRIMNFVNLHMYHDADNAVAVSESPSIYVSRRRDALIEALVEVAPLLNPMDSLFIFGDFNFRLDGHLLINFLEKKFGKIEMGKKAVKAPQSAFDWVNGVDAYLDELKQFDLEGVPAMEAIAQATGVELGEFSRKFRPTYAYAVPSEDKKSENEKSLEVINCNSPRPYATARIPAWCDRVLFNPSALAAMSNESSFQKKSSSSGGALLPKGRGREGCASAAAHASSYVYTCTEITQMDHQAVYLLADIRIF